jgi:hypothetical protein
MENNFEFGGFNNDFGADNSAFDTFGGVEEMPAAAATRSTLDGVQTTTQSTIQAGGYRDITAVQERFANLSKEEAEERRANGAAFQWISTYVEKVEWEQHKTDPDKQQLKNPKFLGWEVITADSSQMPKPISNNDLLAYIIKNCPETGQIGSGATGLKLREVKRTDKATGDTYKSVTLVPQDSKIKKYEPTKVKAAKRQKFEEDEVTPVLQLKQSAKGKENPEPSDYKYVYEWISEEVEKALGKKRSLRNKSEQKSTNAFNTLVFLQSTGKLKIDL